MSEGGVKSAWNGQERGLRPTAEGPRGTAIRLKPQEDTGSARVRSREAGT